jgi:hypothetical protein
MICYLHMKDGSTITVNGVSSFKPLDAYWIELLDVSNNVLVVVSCANMSYISTF